MTAHEEQQKIAKVLPYFHWGAAAFLVCAFIFWLIAPSPPGYLLTFVVVGILWFGAIVWMWRMWCFTGTIMVLPIFAFGYLVPPRLFSQSSQVGELQGIFLAFSVVAFLLWTLRRQVIRFARLEQ